jgi:hypothetical protein
MIFTGDYCQCFDVVIFDTGKTYYKWYILKIGQNITKRRIKQQRNSWVLLVLKEAYS